MNSSRTSNPQLLQRPILCQGVVQHYEWGRRGESSLVGRLAKGADSSKPYAELWFGAHPKGAAKIRGGQTLRDLIASNPKIALGPAVAERYHDSLPFMCKVLSVAKALSIQAHPDAERAKLLHAKNPQWYPDDSQKPEIGIAVGAVRLLIGFRPLSETLDLLVAFPEFRALFNPAVPALRQPGNQAEELALRRELYRASLQVPPEKICLAVRKALENSKPGVATVERGTGPARDIQLLLEELNQQFPEGDSGILAIFFLNYLELSPGEAIFIGPNTPHAYLSGELLECMANSDNVVRAGLTSKVRDDEALIDMLNFSEASPKKQAGATQGGSQGIHWYASEAQEFSAGVLGDWGIWGELPVGVPCIVVGINGSVALECVGGDIVIPPGEAAFVSAVVRGARIRVLPSTEAASHRDGAGQALAFVGRALS